MSKTKLSSSGAVAGRCAVVVGIALSVLSSQAGAQTLDAMIAQQKQAMLDEQAKKDKALQLQSIPPLQLQAPQVGPGLPSLPQLSGVSVQEAPPPPPPPPPQKAVFNLANLTFIALYGVGPDLTAEIAYNGTVARGGGCVAQQTRRKRGTSKILPEL